MVDTISFLFYNLTSWWLLWRRLQKSGKTKLREGAERDGPAWGYSCYTILRSDLFIHYRCLLESLILETNCCNINLVPCLSIESILPCVWFWFDPDILFFFEINIWRWFDSKLNPFFSAVYVKFKTTDKFPLALIFLWLFYDKECLIYFHGLSQH